MPAGALCQACSRPAAGGAVWPDRRASCPPCVRAAVRDPGEAREVLVAAQRALAAALREAEGPAPPPPSLARVGVVLVDAYALARHADDLAAPGLRALTVVERRASGPGIAAATIYVLDGLPRDYLVGTLAHELVHVWQEGQRLGRRFPEPAPELALREGAAVWLQREVLRRAGAVRLVELLEHNGDPVYGDGLRRFEALVRARGLADALRLSTSGRFPAGY